LLIVIILTKCEIISNFLTESGKRLLSLSLSLTHTHFLWLLCVDKKSSLIWQTCHKMNKLKMFQKKLFTPVNNYFMRKIYAGFSQPRQIFPLWFFNNTVGVQSSVNSALELGCNAKTTRNTVACVLRLQFEKGGKVKPGFERYTQIAANKCKFQS
jgi:hypothetical protein